MSNEEVLKTLKEFRETLKADFIKNLADIDIVILLFENEKEEQPYLGTGELKSKESGI